MNAETHTMAEMPKYKCHKEVHALKISRVVDHTQAKEADKTTGGIVHPEDTRFAPIVVDRDWLARFGPAYDGDLGYYVVYADGYKSWSPTKAFEDGYTRLGDTS